MLGWFKNDISAEERKQLNAFFRVHVNSRNIKQLMLGACYGSVAAITITPLQDIPGLDQTSRMNVPASKKR
ncbi:hypothetical protein DIU31_003155 [Mucilaginibacter rubeus]|uniref:4-alpha-glucanotransferase n=2 Tax=Mucilaginibacter rubeus TaxID=2027860 RepID=A0AAE6JBF8_9SPHI|nr:4-alpha-glucanotransferase [Mucilaginibacter gossypii]QEM02562.1 hypothetical protein DIU31_003155 [Mucilaginibacter rubeus]QEM15182.1 hypothetical protein DIU38_003185 [Mucilaginibacter gossypii]QTE47128.1 4-alpha-glucanotransferase [Mucilaginibacter rubeus]QTE53729.1 4-alpha-glucanotransferase [Mucilaginibacter rubeus]QTE60232.1 4-alpha-glucanotransferase [Mucilaginibacter rubeus]